MVIVVEESKFPPKKQLPRGSTLTAAPMLPPEQLTSPLKTNCASQHTLHPPPRPPRSTVNLVSRSVQPDDSVQIKLQENRHCNCKHSRCIKLYCECFASRAYCDGCTCTGCHNNVENEAERQNVIDNILERKPNAFKQKIAANQHEVPNIEVDFGDAYFLQLKLCFGSQTAIEDEHKIGCNCKKSGCRKRYCECFGARIRCSENCKCVDCKNFEGYKERPSPRTVNGNTSVCIQKMNATMKSEVGVFGDWSSEECKNTIDKGSWNSKEPLISRLLQSQQKHMLPAITVGQNQTVRSLASQGAKSCHEGQANQTAELSGSTSMKHTADTNDLGINDAYTEAKPMSPRTLALMCDEKDKFMRNASLNQAINRVFKTDVYLEQERFVLSKFRDFLTTLISRANIKDIIYTRDTKELCSSLVVVSEAVNRSAEKYGSSNSPTVGQNQTVRSLASQGAKSCLDGLADQTAELSDTTSMKQVTISEKDDPSINAAATWETQVAEMMDQHRSDDNQIMEE